MNRTLNVSIIQMPPGDTPANLAYLRGAVDTLMNGYVRPELVIGVEFGISAQPCPVPGAVTDFLGAIAKKHGIYFIPGTMAESAPELPQGAFYNTCPVFGPDGTLLASYRKKTPFRPGEGSVPSTDDRLCTFYIPEKDITVGLLICYEQFFPEIPRALALQGAELLVCPALDPMEYAYIPDIIPRARALENELFYIWTCGAGNGAKGTLCGGSTIVDPEGAVVYKCGEGPMLITQTLDFAQVARKRLCGRDQHLNSLRSFHVPTPYAGRVGEAPVYRDMPPLTQTPDEYAKRLEEQGLAPLPRKARTEEHQAERLLDNLFESAESAAI